MCSKIQLKILTQQSITHTHAHTLGDIPTIPSSLLCSFCFYQLVDRCHCSSGVNQRLRGLCVSHLVDVVTLVQRHSLTPTHAPLTPSQHDPISHSLLKQLFCSTVVSMTSLCLHIVTGSSISTLLLTLSL